MLPPFFTENMEKFGQMDGQKVKLKSPPCMSTGGLKNSPCLHGFSVNHAYLFFVLSKLPGSHSCLPPKNQTVVKNTHFDDGDWEIRMFTLVI